MKKRFPNLWSSNNQSVFSLKTYIVTIDKMKQLVLLKMQPMKSISMHYEHHTVRSCNLACLYWTVPFKKKNFIIFIHIILISWVQIVPLRCCTKILFLTGLEHYFTPPDKHEMNKNKKKQNNTNLKFVWSVMSKVE